MGAIAACDNASCPRGKTVLVVEDEVLIRLMLAEILRDEGYCVVEAASGDEALSVLASSIPVDAVMTDVNMPGSLDGMALARYVRTTRPELKVIVVSGRPAPEANGAADAFLSKPYNLERVVTAIGALLSDERR